MELPNAIYAVQYALTNEAAWYDFIAMTCLGQDLQFAQALCAVGNFTPLLIIIAFSADR